MSDNTRGPFIRDVFFVPRGLNCLKKNASCHLGHQSYRSIRGFEEVFFDEKKAIESEPLEKVHELIAIWSSVYRWKSRIDWFQIYEPTSFSITTHHSIKRERFDRLIFVTLLQMKNESFIYSQASLRYFVSQLDALL